MDTSEGGRKRTPSSMARKLWMVNGTSCSISIRCGPSKPMDSIGYLARDGKHFYQYDDMSSLKKSRGHEKTTVTEGWFHDMKGEWLYVRSEDDPSAHTWQAAVLDHAF